MSEDSLRRWLQQRAIDLRNASYPTLPLRFANVPFQQPKNKTSWAAVYTDNGDAFNTNIGRTKIIRTPGTIVVEVKVPADTGTALCNNIAKMFGDGFQNINTSLGDATITTRAATIRDTPEGSEFWTKSVFVPYWKDETYRPQ